MYMILKSLILQQFRRNLGIGFTFILLSFGVFGNDSTASIAFSITHLPSTALADENIVCKTLKPFFHIFKPLLNVRKFRFCLCVFACGFG